MVRNMEFTSLHSASDREQKKLAPRMPSSPHFSVIENATVVLPVPARPLIHRTCPDFRWAVVAAAFSRDVRIQPSASVSTSLLVPFRHPRRTIFESYCARFAYVDKKDTIESQMFSRVLSGGVGHTYFPAVSLSVAWVNSGFSRHIRKTYCLNFLMHDVHSVVDTLYKYQPCVLGREPRASLPVHLEAVSGRQRLKNERGSLELTKKSWIDVLISCTRPSNFRASALLVKNRFIAPRFLMCCARSAMPRHVLSITYQKKSLHERNTSLLGQLIYPLLHVLIPLAARSRTKLLERVFQGYDARIQRIHAIYIRLHSLMLPRQRMSVSNR